MALTLILVGIIGLLAGGLVNVLADDLPQRKNPTLPHYPDGTQRSPATWLGLTAFLMGKRTSPNGAKLSWRHPIAEMLTAALMVLVVARTNAGMPEATGLQVVFWLAYMAIFVLITVIDIEHKLILFVVIIPAMVLGVLDAVLTPPIHAVVTNVDFIDKPNLGDALIGGAVGFIVFFILYNGGFLFTYVMGKLRGETIDTVAFGYGDVMMATFSGLILGWQNLIFAIFITVFLGALGALLYVIFRRVAGGKYNLFTALPYGPYIVVGTFLMLIFSQEMACVLLRQCQ